VLTVYKLPINRLRRKGAYGKRNTRSACGKVDGIPHAITSSEQYCGMRYLSRINGPSDTLLTLVVASIYARHKPFQNRNTAVKFLTAVNNRSSSPRKGTPHLQIVQTISQSIVCTYCGWRESILTKLTYCYH
jgi:hypothetical protein